MNLERAENSSIISSHTQYKSTQSFRALHLFGISWQQACTSLQGHTHYSLPHHTVAQAVQLCTNATVMIRMLKRIFGEGDA